MTNFQKFVEVMNKVFGAGFTEENFDFGHFRCSPCGIFKKGVCEATTCGKCSAWWNEEYVKKQCSTCCYSHKRRIWSGDGTVDALECWAEKEPPIVSAEGNCESWARKEKEEKND